MNRRAKFAIYWIATAVFAVWFDENAAIPMAKSSPWAGSPVHEKLVELFFIFALGVVAGWYYAILDPGECPPEDDSSGEPHD